jgi:hypothetical protein
MSSSSSHSANRRGSVSASRTFDPRGVQTVVGLFLQAEFGGLIA